jgi:KaiC/GvpD/RAD55 family RecA-like ATPase
MNENFAIPLRVLEFFLESCRLVNYIQVSDRIGRLEIRAQDIDPEYLLCQLFGIPTAIRGLDELFGGGGLMLVESALDSSLPQISGRAVLSMGPFGTGKSLLALQMATEVARKGGAAWIMPMEQTTEECLYSLESMGMLSGELPFRIAHSVPKAIQLLENPDAEKGALFLIRTIKERFDDFAIAFEENARLMNRYPLRLIVVDPITAVSQQDSSADMRSKMLRLFEAVTSAGTNIWLVAEEDSHGGTLVEQSIADTVIHLTHQRMHGYSQRCIEVTKSRLQREQRGMHDFSIGPGRGFTVFPSPAAVRSKLQKRSVRVPDTPVAFGLPSIDAVLGKTSLYSGDVIVLDGPSGSGKSYVAMAFLLSSDLPRSGDSSAADTAMLVTNVEAELSARRQLEDVYSMARHKAGFTRRPTAVDVIGIPGGYVKPGYILQRIEDEFERARLRRDSIARVVVDNIVNMELGCPFISADHTFGDTLVDLLRKHRVTSLFVCREEIRNSEARLQQSIVNGADCMLRFTVRDAKRHVEIRKSRGMHHQTGPCPLENGDVDIASESTREASS